jgi:hypothetical protein
MEPVTVLAAPQNVIFTVTQYTMLIRKLKKGTDRSVHGH